MYAKRRNLFLQAFDEQGQAQEDDSTLLRHGTVEVKNDYSQHFLETRERPQNFIRDVTVEDGFAEYPKLAKLLAAKDEMVESRKTPPMHVQADLKTFDLRNLGTKFDLIYIDPPWEEYARRAAPFVVGGKKSPRGSSSSPSSSSSNSTCAASSHLDQVWRYEDLEALPIGEIGDVPSFVFLWCGSGGRVTEGAVQGALHVEDGRRLLKKWGYRRCEEVCWVKTNKQGPQLQPDLPTSTTSLLVRTKEHCLMGIKGSVRRNRDGHIIHCNVHTDLVVAEQPTDPLSTAKPKEIYKIMEQFCLGRRRLELFGCPHNIRPGWVTVGKDLPGTNYDATTYLEWMSVPGMNPDGTPCAGHLLGSTPLIEELRPKTPPREQREREAQMGGGGGGGGGGIEGGSPSFRPRSGSIPPMWPRPGQFSPHNHLRKQQQYQYFEQEQHFHHQQMQQQADFHHHQQQQEQQEQQEQFYYNEEQQYHHFQQGYEEAPQSFYSPYYQQQHPQQQHPQQQQQQQGGFSSPYSSPPSPRGFHPSSFPPAPPPSPVSWGPPSPEHAPSTPSSSYGGWDHYTSPSARGRGGGRGRGRPPLPHF
jgi:mRNA (2'-O-methyladenosine-N6-)-methyltransferase